MTNVAEEIKWVITYVHTKAKGKYPLSENIFAEAKAMLTADYLELNTDDELIDMTIAWLNYKRAGVCDLIRPGKNTWQMDALMDIDLTINYLKDLKETKR